MNRVCIQQFTAIRREHSDRRFRIPQWRNRLNGWNSNGETASVPIGKLLYIVVEKLLQWRNCISIGNRSNGLSRENGSNKLLVSQWGNVQQKNLHVRLSVELFRNAFDSIFRAAFELEVRRVRRASNAMKLTVWMATFKIVNYGDSCLCGGLLSNG